MTPQVRVDADADAPSESMLVCWLVYSILLNIPNNCQAPIHPMALLPAFVSSNIADLLSKPLPTSTHHRFLLAIGDNTTSPSTSVASTVDITVAATVVASASTVVASAPTATSASDSDQTLHPNLVSAPTPPIALDTGASFLTPFASDFLPVNQAPYGLIRSAALSNSVSKALASTPVDPYTLITGEDTTISFDLSSPDTIDSASGPSSTKVSFDIRQFGTASLTFIFSPNLSLIKVFVTPTQVDWLHWVPLPRLTPTDSYFHIFGRDYLQAFALLHLIPIWIALVSALLRSE